MASPTQQPTLETPRSVEVHIVWVPDRNELTLATTGGDSMQYRGMMVKAQDALNQLESGKAKSNRVHLAPGPLARQH